MLEDTGASFLITTSEHRSNLDVQRNINIIELDTGWQAISRQSLNNLASRVTPGQLAYVIYDVGFYGQAKGSDGGTRQSNALPGE
jgi:hypothetical protein